MAISGRLGAYIERLAFTSRGFENARDEFGDVRDETESAAVCRREDFQAGARGQLVGLAEQLRDDMGKATMRGPNALWTR